MLQADEARALIDAIDTTSLPGLRDRALIGLMVYTFAGQTVDFLLSKRRDVAAAKAFFEKAIRNEGRPPQTITLDGYAATHRAVREMKTDGLLPGRTRLRSSKYLNNLIEQDHRGIKSRTRPHARVQELLLCCHHHRRSGTASSY